VSFPVGGTPRPSESSEQLARDMIDVHGVDAAQVARDNARTAACAGQFIEARKWLRLVELIQRRARHDSAGATASVDAA
jgi:hypothetical protein